MTAPFTIHYPGFLRLAGLLDPAVPAAGTMSTGDAGEWELAVGALAGQLSEYHTPLPGADRTAVLGLAEAFGASARAGAALRWCPDPRADTEQ
ncbi:hypothetical protein SAMN05216371_0182 [Streptomyces sp. TLI_053]|uniref:hypothetical protein n=1 Tax=Streptomyces sp. TLI_053 TaxID=1855352 RepID=UPI000879E53F|nr:hypothetical protein [Streptomyces sp. TLI_053]SDS57036.1 hypothetical protein SAMN05216371_0182 [Streptomyces sp. TLI_053]